MGKPFTIGAVPVQPVLGVARDEVWFCGPERVTGLRMGDDGRIIVTLSRSILGKIENLSVSEDASDGE